MLTLKKYLQFYCKALSGMKQLVFPTYNRVSRVILWNKRMLREALN